MSTVELMHFASRTVSLDREREYVQDAPYAYRKPRGFWVSVTGDDDWPSWCRREEFAVERLEVGHTVTVSTDANILHIEDLSAFDRFQQAFSVEGEFERRHPSLTSKSDWPIDWRAVAEQYDGIIIAPYQWLRRLGDSSWYYGWDVASGCIWNLNAIASVSRTAVMA